MEDSQIVDLFLKRDETAISKTADKFGNRLRSLALGIVADAQTAEECENDTYLKAWESIPPHEPRDYLYAFLARITRHIAINCCRDRGRLKRSAVLCELSEEMEQCIPSPDDVECRIDGIVLSEAINRFLSGLNEEKRNIFLRRYWYLDSISDISKRYGVSERNVTTVLFRCREKLRKQLIEEGYTL